MLVQRVVMPLTGALSWTGLDDSGEPVGPVEKDLAYLSALELIAEHAAGVRGQPA